MKDLSPLARELVKAGRSAGAPSDADKERIREALEQRLALPPEAGPPGAGPSEPQPSGDPNASALPAASGAPWALIAGAGAAVIAGVLYWRLSVGPEVLPPGVPPATPAVSVPSATPSPPAPRSENSPPVSTPSVSPLPAAAARMPAPSVKQPSETRPKSRLAEEVALLSRATSALHTGRSQDALRALAEHQQKFPQGHLSVERIAARAQALCQLGRKAEAERELGRLSPTSPQAARARRACGE